MRRKVFNDSHGNKFTLFYKNQFQVDLLPFGEIENPDRTVTFPGLGLTTISTLGLGEVYKSSVSVDIGLKNSFKVSTIPRIVLLKLIAWEDRPEVRPKDAVDITYIIQNHFNICQEDIYENHLDLFDDKNEIIDISTRVLGRHIGDILWHNPSLKDRILLLLDGQTSEIEKAPLAEAMIKGYAWNVKTAIDKLQLLYQGITDIL